MYETRMHTWWCVLLSHISLYSRFYDLCASI